MMKAVFFDFDGVLTTDATGSSSICKYISNCTGIDLEELESEYCRYNTDLTYGRVTHSDIWQKLCNNLKCEIV